MCRVGDGGPRMELRAGLCLPLDGDAPEAGRDSWKPERVVFPPGSNRRATSCLTNPNTVGSLRTSSTASLSRGAIAVVALDNGVSWR